MRAYKLTDQTGCTLNHTQWGKGVSHTATGKHKHLCSNGYIHFYESPLIAVIRNCKDANIKNPILWIAEASGELDRQPLKSGAKTLKTIRQIPLPVISTEQMIAFAILCAKKVCDNKLWLVWANSWLKGIDRSEAAAADAAYAAKAAADTADAAADAAAYAAYAAAAVKADAAAADAAAYAADADIFIKAKQINFHRLALKAIKLCPSNSSGHSVNKS